jgi:predicted nucleic acid-binding protein
MMTTLLTSGDIHHYCQLDSNGRQAYFNPYFVHDERPGGVLSSYEICYSLFEQDLAPIPGAARQAFVNCWSELLDIHNTLDWNGPLIWLETFEEREDRAIQDMYAALELIDAPIRDEQGLNHFPLTRRLQMLTEQLCIVPLQTLSLEERRWRTPELPVLGRMQPKFDSQSIVMDNNNLLHLLNQLDPTGQQRIDIHPHGPLDRAVAQRCQELLTALGGSKIIVPMVVFEEFHRKAHELDGFQRALDVMKVIAAGEGEILYTAAFAFDSLSIEIVATFVEVHGAINNLDLADALIVAHAVHHSCPLASGDQKIRAAARAFPFLSLG